MNTNVDNYQPLLNEQQFKDYAEKAWLEVESQGLTPVAASVVGSQLRGTAVDGSDVDVMVLVKEKNRNAFTNHVHKENSDLMVDSVFFLAERYEKSTPFQEFLASPFLVVDKNWLPFLRSLKVNPYMSQLAFQKLVVTTLNRKNVPAYKKARAVASAYYSHSTGSTLVPRKYVNFDEPMPEVERFVKELYPEVDSDVVEFFK